MVHRVAKSQTWLKQLSTHACKGCIIFHCVCIPVPHFICSSLNGHLGCSHILIIVSNAAVNIGVQISLWVLAFNSFESVPRSGIAGSYGNSRFNFLRNCHTDSNYTISHSHQQNIGVPISAHSLRHLTFLSFFLFLIEDSLMSMKVVSECCFNSCFPND